MHARLLTALPLIALTLATGCRTKPEGNMVVMVIESSPNNLDLRIGTDAQSERIGGLIFDPLVHKDEHYNPQPWIAERWEQPEPTRMVFHIRHGVTFHDGRPLTAEDVAYTIRSLQDGSIVTSKGASLSAIKQVETPDPYTLVLHLDKPDASLLFNLSDGLFGIVPRGSGKELGAAPIGSGPFRFVSQVVDKEVVVERNPQSWSGVPKIERVRFAVIPDAVTTALELRKGSADIASNVITQDMVWAMRNEKEIITDVGPGSILNYINFNCNDTLLKHREVRQAIALAINRQPILHALFRDHARPAASLLPNGHWAQAAATELPDLSFNPERARKLLDTAGFPVRPNGSRFQLTMKTSTDETTRLLAAILQQQLRAVGIDLQIRSNEFGTFYADVTKGAFQIYGLRWIGSNEDPDIFRYTVSSKSFPPKGANRGHYSNPEVDRLIAEASVEPDQAKRRPIYVHIQQLLAEDAAGVNLWYLDNTVVHSRRVTNIHPNPSASYDFLREAEVMH
ncbi:ABC transporter substrate-binding protein [Terriglobus sp. 2YAB30_2]|uniref:ABC transporter substrate-binding protein n=1 Tax=unclassified Terriglobus TaxID=2628988 RepID=UPI003F95AC00